MALFQTDLPNPVHAIRYFSTKINLGVNLTNLRDQMEEHPDYPSMLSMYDLLEHFNAHPVSGRIDKEHLHKLPTPFIAYLDNAGGEFVVVDKVVNGTVHYFSGSRKEVANKRVGIQTFTQQWSGTVLAIDEKAKEGLKRSWYNNSLVKITDHKAIFFFILLFMAGLGSNIMHRTVAHYLFFSISQTLCFAGLLVSALLLWYDLDSSNSFLKKICMASRKTNCEAVLSSKYAKVLTYFSWSEIGFAYFAAGYICLTLNPEMGLHAICVFSLASLLYIPYSLGYQAFIIKQWCPLCLVIQFIFLLSGGAAIALMQGNFTDALYHFDSFALFGFSLIIPVSFWSFFKNVYTKYRYLRPRSITLSRLKANPTVFKTLLASQNKMTTIPENLGVSIGNNKGRHRIVKVCNPYCSPCSKAHPVIETLINENPDLEVIIIFTSISKKAALLGNPVKNIIYHSQTSNDEHYIRQMLNDWYSNPVKDPVKFNELYPVNDEQFNCDAILQGMVEWCGENMVAYTPTYFIDGYKLPEIYSIDEVKDLLVP